MTWLFCSIGNISRREAWGDKKYHSAFVFCVERAIVYMRWPCSHSPGKACVGMYVVIRAVPYVFKTPLRDYFLWLQLTTNSRNYLISWLTIRNCVETIYVIFLAIYQLVIFNKIADRFSLTYYDIGSSIKSNSKLSSVVTCWIVMI